jgi:PEGA domain
MRASFVVVAVVGALVGTSALASSDSRGGGRSSGHSNSGGRAGHQGSSASSSRSGDTRQHRAVPRNSSNRGATTSYRTGGERRSQGYRSSRSSSYRNRSYYGYRSYYRPRLSLYLGSPLYYDNYGYGGYYPEYYPETYAAAPYAPDYGYRGPVEDTEDARAESDYRDGDGDGMADVAGSGRLQLDVQPADATIYVDGQFHGTANNDTVLLLTPGRHTVELARPGFQSERRVVEVGTGEARSLSIALQPARR